MGKVSKRKLRRERFERRFVPHSTVDWRIVAVIGALGAAALGAGFFGQWGAALRGVEDAEPVPYSMWILAAGAVALGVAIWIGTSGDAIVRVGSGGVGEERSGTTQRIPWWAIDSLAMDGDVLVVKGADEAGAKATLRVRRTTSPQAVAWIVSECRLRVPGALELSREEQDAVGDAHKHGGEWVEPPPLQVVGKRCAESDKVIAYEPDARTCPRCERVYHKTKVPKTCGCGADLSALREKKAAKDPKAAAKSEAKEAEA